jgi:hypothetical protein
MLRLAAAMTICITSALRAQFPPVGVIDYYGIRTVARRDVEVALGIRVGDSLRISKREDIEAIESRIRSVPGVVTARVNPVCCENGRTTVYVGIEERGTSALAVRAAPTGDISLPPDILAAGGAYEEAHTAAILRGNFAEDITAGHSLMNDSAARAIQMQFIGFAARDTELLRNVLRDSRLASQRTLAAQILGYAADKRTVIDDLVFATRDASANVRNAATRALWLIGALAQREPARNIRLPYEPFVDLLNSVTWSDRNKSSLALAALSAGRDTALLSLLRARAIPALTDIARWQAPGHSLAGLMILGRIAGMPDDAILAASEKGEKERIINAASKRP